MGSLPLAIDALLYLIPVVVLVVFGYIDWRIRRIPNAVWKPLFAVSFAFLSYRVFDVYGTPMFEPLLIQVLVSAVSVGGLGLFAGVTGLFGGADVKGLLWISITLPVYPSFTSFVYEPVVGVLSFSVFLNALLLGVAYQGVLIAVNAVRGDWDLRMVAGVRVPVGSLTAMHGRIIRKPMGVSDVINTVQSGGDITDAGLDPCLDLDTLRMYLRWRATSLTEIRVDSSWFRSSAPVPWITGEFSDGRVDRVAGFDEVTESSPRVDGLGVAWAFPGEEVDPWGASAFVQTAGEKYVWMSESVYGDSPASIRRGLEMVSSQRTVWVSPGLPFFVLLAGGAILSGLGVDLFGFVVRAI
jgi:Type IV leader peptidase family.